MLYRTFAKGVVVQSLSFEPKQSSMGSNVIEQDVINVLPNIRSVFPETWIYDSIDGNDIGYCYLLN